MDATHVCVRRKDFLDGKFQTDRVGMIIESMDQVQTPLKKTGEFKRGAYIGVSYPGILQQAWIRAIWRRTFCPTGWHLFDEVASFGALGHHLSCDACDLSLVLGRAFPGDYDWRAHFEREKAA